MSDSGVTWYIRWKDAQVPEIEYKVSTRMVGSEVIQLVVESNEDSESCFLNTQAASWLAGMLARLVKEVNDA